MPRLCAFAAAATETLGGSTWTVLTRREGASPDEPAAAVARGGSPAEVGAQFATVVVGYGPWLVEIGMSATAATGDVVLTSLDALAGVAVRGAR